MLFGRRTSLFVGLSLLVSSTNGFRVPAAGVRAAAQRATARSTPPVAVVIEISSQDEFDKALEGAGGSLVVIDYSTSWCGPCKIIAPKFDEFSEQYKNVAFLKVRKALRRGWPAPHPMHGLRPPFFAGPIALSGLLWLIALCRGRRIFGSLN